MCYGNDFVAGVGDRRRRPRRLACICREIGGRRGDQVAGRRDDGWDDWDDLSDLLEDRHCGCRD